MNKFQKQVRHKTKAIQKGNPGLPKAIAKGKAVLVVLKEMGYGKCDT